LYKRDKYTNNKYVIKNINQYTEIIFNDFFAESKFAESTLLMNNFKKFVFIMDNLKKIDMLYFIPSNRYPSKGFDTLIENIKNFEDKLLMGSDNENEMKVYLNLLIYYELIKNKKLFNIIKRKYTT